MVRLTPVLSLALLGCFNVTSNELAAAREEGYAEGEAAGFADGYAKAEEDFEARLAAVESRLTAAEADIDTMEVSSWDEARVAAIEADVDALGTGLADEVLARQDADTALASSITLEADTRATADSTHEGSLGSLDSAITVVAYDLSVAQADILVLDGRVDTTEVDILALQGSATSAASALSALDTRVTDSASDIATLQASTTAAQSALDARVTVAETALSGLGGRVDTTETSIDALLADVSDHEARLLVLEAYSTDLGTLALLTDYLSVSGTSVIVEGANFIVRSGTGDSESADGTGNIIIGWNEASGSETRVGSHNLVMGLRNEYTGVGSIVSGSDNVVDAHGVMALGSRNTTYSADHTAGLVAFRSEVSDEFSSVISAWDAVNSGYASVIVGGEANELRGDYGVIAGGYGNDVGDSSAIPEYAAVFGGYGNIASGDYAVAAGGDQVTASGSYSGAFGGYGNVSAAGGGVVVGGGSNASVNNTAYGTYPVLVGGYGNAIGASTFYSTVVGGRDNGIGAYTYNTQLGGYLQTCSTADYAVCEN